MGLSHEVHLRLGAQLFEELQAHAAGSGLTVSTAARLLLTRALRIGSGQMTTGLADQAALAALVAAEHAVLMVASILPEGEQRMRALAERASRAAEERLAILAEPAAPGAEGR